MPLGQRVANLVASIIRSWLFVFGQLTFIALWMLLNHYPSLSFDAFPFEKLRIILSIESSFIGSILLMSQHYQGKKDREMAYNDYQLDIEMEKEMSEMYPMIKEIHQVLIKK